MENDSMRLINSVHEETCGMNVRVIYVDMF